MATRSPRAPAHPTQPPTLPHTPHTPHTHTTCTRTRRARRQLAAEQEASLRLKGENGLLRRRYDEQAAVVEEGRAALRAADADKRALQARERACVGGSRGRGWGGLMRTRGWQLGAPQPPACPPTPPLKLAPSPSSPSCAHAHKQGVIEGLRHDVVALQRDVAGRDQAIAEKERRILELKRTVQVCICSGGCGGGC